MGWDFGVTLLSWTVAGFIVAPMFVVVIEVVAALGARRASNDPLPAAALPAIAVLIPAHDEEASIGQCIASVQKGLSSADRIVVVAHNCQDATAQLARKMGAEVLEVNDNHGGGKPDALKAGLRHLDAGMPDVVVIVDADCVASEGAVLALAETTWQLNRPVMGAYFFLPPNGASGLAKLSSLATLLKNFVRPLGLHALSLPCLLNGSGSAYPFKVIRDARQGEGAIAEDYQLTVDLLRQGYPTVFIPQAKVVGQLPSREPTALRQRRRWEHGHLFLATRVAPGLLLEGLRRLDMNRIAVALELAVPPLAFLILTWIAAAALAIGLLLLGGHGLVGPLALLLVGALLLGTAVSAAWMRFAGARQTLDALVATPRYLLWKLPLYSGFFRNRETHWLKTGRD